MKLQIMINEYPKRMKFTVNVKKTPPIKKTPGFDRPRTKLLQSHLNEIGFEYPVHDNEDFVVEFVEKIGPNKERWYVGS